MATNKQTLNQTFHLPISFPHQVPKEHDDHLQFAIHTPFYEFDHLPFVCKLRYFLSVDRSR